MPTDNLARAALLVAATAAPFSAAQAQSGESQSAVVTTTLLGDITTIQPQRSSRVHFQGAFGIASSDYSRGAYDNEAKSLDQVAFSTELSSTIELMDGKRGALSGLNLVLGTAQGIASGEERPALSENGHWYESNWYAGVAAHLGANWLGGLTYSVFTSRLGDTDPSHEIALAAQYAGNDAIGSLKPQFRLTVPVAGEADEGWLVSANIEPQTRIGTIDGSPVMLLFPVEVGVGVDDYYGGSSGSASYIDLGTAVNVPLTFVPDDYGSWSVEGGVGLLVRSDDLRQEDPSFADDSVIPSATLTLSFVY